MERQHKFLNVLTNKLSLVLYYIDQYMEEHFITSDSLQSRRKGMAHNQYIQIDAEA